MKKDFREMNLEPVDYNTGANCEALETYLKNSGEPGKYCGFECLAPHYSHKDNGITDWTGFPGSGKTYFALQVLFYLSESIGTRHLIYVPDVGTYLEVMAKLLKMKTGRDFSDKYQNKITTEEMYAARTWINHHFIVLKRKKIQQPITAIDFWEYCCNYEDASGTVQVGFIDSWKNMYKDMAGYAREDQYLDYALSYRNELSEEYKKHFHTVAHATKTEFEESSTGAKKKRRVPDANDIKGGGSWYANGKNIITVDFPDKTNFAADLLISKTKPEDVGRAGVIIGQLFLDPAKGRYYEIYDGRRYYAGELKKANMPDPTLPYGNTRSFYETDNTSAPW